MWEGCADCIPINHLLFENLYMVDANLLVHNISNNAPLKLSTQSFILAQKKPLVTWFMTFYLEKDQQIKDVIGFIES